jgi:hypothetical protein
MSELFKISSGLYHYKGQLSIDVVATRYKVCKIPVRNFTERK